jgi:hypothetical protein
MARNHSTISEEKVPKTAFFKLKVSKILFQQNDENESEKNKNIKVF